MVDKKNIKWFASAFFANEGVSATLAYKITQRVGFSEMLI
jgi:hypothetical protein